MLDTYLNDRTLLFPDEVNGWRDAVEQVSKPLLDAGSISRGYVDAMLNSIADGGTYIHLGFGIALPHARPETGVLKTDMAALWTPDEVLLADDPAHPIRLFICLAAADSTTHLEALQALGSVLSDDNIRDELLAARTPEQATAVLNQISTTNQGESK